VTSKKDQEAWLSKNVVQWGKKASQFVNLQLSTKGKKHLDSIPQDRNVFLIANHQSVMDILAIYATSEQMFGFIAKKELQKIPILRFWMTVQGCVFIDRKNTVETIQKLNTLGKDGKPCRIAAFPEGTRSKSGQMAPFKKGVLKTAWHLDSILVPAHITGTREAWENRVKVLNKYPVSVEFFKTWDLRDIKKEMSFDSFMESLSQLYKIRDVHPV
jgi:1-acyl-sn-glycerol-3-phosphate acyltransferase